MSPSILAIAQSLPNGFHDTVLRRCELDSQHATVALELELWIGDLSGPPPQRGRRQKALLEFRGVRRFEIEPPGPGALTSETTGCTFDLGAPVDHEDRTAATWSEPDGPRGSFFLSERNSSIDFDAETVEIRFLEFIDGDQNTNPPLLPGEEVELATEE